MHEDFDRLTKLNVEIGAAEGAGNRDLLEPILAPVMAFRRAKGDVVDRAAFLDQLAPSPPRATDVESIALLGSHRAMVTCVVSMEVEGERKAFHNVRLFVRAAEGEWQLLGWANEPA